ncbi:uncharacterized protein LOC111058817 [Nilaparvata lugens]|uniref:uncharacterized protein LOC111058817 n=1 Tax=Nilaparvata lugens TaxID=108931 RepID=UPI00193E0231|nr:uncharacterized protein LOC111058817 [Nilaparvata lugens]
MMISMYIRDDQRMWDQYLMELQYAYNTATHDSTGYTPAMLNLGHSLRTPSTMEYSSMIWKILFFFKYYGTSLELSREGPQGLDVSILEQMKEFKALIEQCNKNLQRASESQARYFNLRRREVNFRVGDEVWYRQHPLSSDVESFAAKFAAKYDGPYLVTARIGPNLYSLSRDGRTTTSKAHVKDLKKYVV